jgi:23S rRNA pseudouridine1911/1915/1917 synthase
METELKPLLDWLLQKHPETPKGRAKQWILAGRVSVGGEIIRKPHHRLADPGDTLELGSRNATTLACGSGWQFHPRVSLLYLDAALAVVNKGPGLLSVSASAEDLSAQSILADFLSGKLKARRPGEAGRTLPPAYRRLDPLPVHRLDQYTTGVFCMATNPTARHHLIEQLKAHTMKREYVAFVEGRASASSGVWRNWLQLSQDELRQHVVAQAPSRDAVPEIREAITNYEVIAEYPIAGGTRFITKLRLRLETGRKHQIRVQAATAGLPLLGDATYNPNIRGRSTTGTAIEFPRQALHAEVLSLEHPNKPGVRMSWTAALPKDLQQLEHGLKAGWF